MKPLFQSLSLSLIAGSLACTGLSVLLSAAPVPVLPEPPATLSAQPDRLTLETAIGLALVHNPGLRAALGDADAAQGQALQSRSWSNPELVLSAEDWPAGSGRGISDSKQTVGLAQTLPFHGKKSLDRAIARSGVERAQAELSLHRAELIREVKIAFFHVLTAERLVEVAAELATVADSSATTARNRVAAGAAADQELLRAELTLEQAKADLADLQGQLDSGRQTLALRLGLPDLKDRPLEGALAQGADLSLLDRSPDRWLADHPSVQAATAARVQAERELQRARLEPYPDVKVELSGGRIGESGQSILQLGLSVPLPIFDRAKGKQREARARARIAAANQAAAEQRLVHAWETSSQRLRTTAQQVARYRERILPKAEDALRLVRIGFEQGKFGLMDLLDTQRTAAQARLAYHQRLLELNAAQAELEALIPEGSNASAQPASPPPSIP